MGQSIVGQYLPYFQWRNTGNVVISLHNDSDITPMGIMFFLTKHKQTVVCVKYWVYCCPLFSGRCQCYEWSYKRSADHSLAWTTAKSYTLDGWCRGSLTVCNTTAGDFYLQVYIPCTERLNRDAIAKTKLGICYIFICQGLCCCRRLLITVYYTCSNRVVVSSMSSLRTCSFVSTIGISHNPPPLISDSFVIKLIDAWSQLVITWNHCNHCDHLEVIVIRTPNITCRAKCLFIIAHVHVQWNLSWFWNSARKAT